MNPRSFCLVRFFCGDNILHQKGRGFLIFLVFFERCVKSVSLIGDSVDRTAETQVSERRLTYTDIAGIIGVKFSDMYFPVTA